jgi:predicted membrane channel-forming protein YqfA (hemolysin III family)
MLNAASGNCPLIACLIAVQVLGILAAIAARLSHGSRRQGAYQCVFFACLGLVGLAAVCSLSVATGWLLPSGTTLAVMVLMTTWDFGRSGRETA